MGFFKSKEPRRFNHKYIYVDERKEKIDKIVQNAKRELGLLPPEEGSYADRLKGAFTNENSHLARRRDNGERISSRAAVCALFVCAMILYYLLKEVYLF